MTVPEPGAAPVVPTCATDDPPARGAFGLLVALQFLTRIPVPRALATPGDPGAGLPWFPVVGLLLGATLAAASWLLSVAFPAPLTAALVIGLLLALTGALHADGLVDVADAAFAHATPERRLEIMRDPRVGSFGVVALVALLLVKVAAVAALPADHRVAALVLAPTLGRWAIVLAAATFPYGRREGLGAPLKQAANARAVAVATAIVLAAVASVGPLGLALLVAAAATTWLLGRWLLGKLPGLTGDAYGAICEVVETVTLLLGASPLFL